MFGHRRTLTVHPSLVIVLLLLERVELRLRLLEPTRAEPVPPSSLDPRRAEPTRAEPVRPSSLDPRRADPVPPEPSPSCRAALLARHLRAVMPRCARLSHELRPRRRGAVPASLAPTRPRTPRRRPPPPPGLPTCCSFFLADYCEYCDISLTHSSVPGRKQHHTGRKHIMNYIEYWASYQAALPTTPPPSAYRPPPRPRACPCPRTPVEAHHTSTPMPPPLT